MKSSLNATDIKKRNQRLILEQIYSSGVTSRVQIAKALKLSKPAVSDNLEKLLHEGIVKEVGESNVGPSGGRHSINLQIDKSFKYIVGIGLNFSTPIFVLSNLRGEILNEINLEISVDTPPAACLELILGGIDTLIKLKGIPMSQLFCIALAAPGVYNENSELISKNEKCAGLPWWEIDLKNELEKKYEKPVIIKNDIKAAALGEWIAGAGTNLYDMIYISCGLGVGAGIIFNNKLIEGNENSSGDIYDYAEYADTKNACVLENCICIPALEKACEQELQNKRADKPAFTEIVQLYGLKKERVVNAVDYICARLALMSYNFTNFLGIRNVVFGGEYNVFGKSFEQAMKNIASKRQNTNIRVQTATLGKYAGLYGMLYLARQKFFDEICDYRL